MAVSERLLATCTLSPAQGGSWPRFGSLPCLSCTAAAQGNPVRPCPMLPSSDPPQKRLHPGRLLPTTDPSELVVGPEMDKTGSYI